MNYICINQETFRYFQDLLSSLQPSEKTSTPALILSRFLDSFIPISNKTTKIQVSDWRQFCLVATWLQSRSVNCALQDSQKWLETAEECLL